MSYDISHIGDGIADAYDNGYKRGYEDGKRDAFKSESYKFEGGSELFTWAGDIGCEVRFRTPSFEKFRAAEEACRRVLDGKENEEVNRDSVRHGAWEMLPPPKKYESGAYCRFRCSECGVIFDHSSRYCSSCGARMDGRVVSK